MPVAELSSLDCTARMTPNPVLTSQQKVTSGVVAASFVAALGMAGVAASWVLFLLASEARIFTLITSIPVLSLSVVRVVQLWGLRRRA